ncbi:hypothetical protein BJ170DRAFT_678252 [Xylariales sp. AK1849]|nr:hypothetical protein BJ170DRAFT_678252 [Xylariales sp. AK1849]
MISPIITLANVATLALFIPRGRAQTPTSPWTISGFRASYLFNEGRTASVNFNVAAATSPHYCSIAIHQIDVFMLPNVSGAYCEGDAGYIFDFTLHPPVAGVMAGGANLTVYTDGLYGSRFLELNDFEQIPDGDGRVDIKYTGATGFEVDIHEK